MPGHRVGRNRVSIIDAGSESPFTSCCALNQRTWSAEASGLLVDQLPHLTGRGYKGKELLGDAGTLPVAPAVERAAAGGS